MGRGSYEPNLEAYLDTPEKIQKCLHCPLPDCVDCRKRNAGRPGRRVIRIAEDGTRELFENVRAAARGACLAEGTIRRAIEKRTAAGGARWSYEV